MKRKKRKTPEELLDRLIDLEKEDEMIFIMFNNNLGFGFSELPGEYIKDKEPDLAFEYEEISGKKSIAEIEDIDPDSIEKIFECPYHKQFIIKEGDTYILKIFAGDTEEEIKTSSLHQIILSFIKYSGMKSMNDFWKLKAEAEKIYKEWKLKAEAEKILETIWT